MGRLARGGGHAAPLSFTTSLYIVIRFTLWVLGLVFILLSVGIPRVLIISVDPSLVCCPISVISVNGWHEVSEQLDPAYLNWGISASPPFQSRYRYFPPAPGRFRCSVQPSAETLKRFGNYQDCQRFHNPWWGGAVVACTCCHVCLLPIMACHSPLRVWQGPRHAGNGSTLILRTTSCFHVISGLSSPLLLQGPSQPACGCVCTLLLLPMGTAMATHAVLLLFVNVLVF
jgi:hypothetical protein